MGISSPVLGFLPGRLFLLRSPNLPNPEIFTGSPCSKESLISSKNNSIMSFAWRLFQPSSSNNCAAKSALVNAIQSILQI
jgi:hypothetical protein